MQGTHLSSTWEIGAELFVNAERVRAGLRAREGSGAFVDPLKSHNPPLSILPLKNWRACDRAAACSTASRRSAG
jgi:hypothetical protein